jgi:hypothetical protein
MMGEVTLDVRTHRNDGFPLSDCLAERVLSQRPRDSLPRILIDHGRREENTMIAVVIHVSGLTNVMTTRPHLKPAARDVLSKVQLVH